MIMKNFILATLLAFAVGTLFTSCMTNDPYVNRGRLGGSALGAATGAIIGNNIKGGNSWAGAAIGGVLGGFAGDAYGKTNSMYQRSRPRPYYYY